MAQTATPDKKVTNTTKLVARKKPVTGSGKGAGTPTGKKIARKKAPGKSGVGTSSIDYNNLAPGVRSSMTSS